MPRLKHNPLGNLEYDKDETGYKDAKGREYCWFYCGMFQLKKEGFENPENNLYPLKKN